MALTQVQNHVGEEFAPDGQHNFYSQEEFLWIFLFSSIMTTFAFMKTYTKLPEPQTEPSSLQEAENGHLCGCHPFLKNDLSLFCRDRKVLLFIACEVARQS